MRTFLVTGGAGFIGSHIAEALVARGDRVRVLDNLSTGRLDNLAGFRAAVEMIEGDIVDPATVDRAVRGVDCVFHEAALASVQWSIDRPLDSHAACCTGTVNVLDAARRAGVRRVIFAASAAAYGAPQKGDSPHLCEAPSGPFRQTGTVPFLRETDQVDPLSPYAAAKLASEHYCHAFSAAFKLETVALRYFNVFGPRQDPASPYSAVIPLFITAMLSGRPPTVFGDGRQSRDFVFVANVAQANLLAADAPNVAGRTFNVAEGRATDLLKLIALLNELLGTNLKPRHEPPRIGDVRESLADITQARQWLGYEPAVDFDEGLRRSIDYYRSMVK